MQEQAKRNKETVLRFNREVIAGGDIAALKEIIHPGFINHTAAPGFDPGIQGIIDFIHMLHDTIGDITVDILDQVAEENKVVTRKTIWGTHTGPFMGITPSMQKVAIHIIDIITLREGKYTEHWSIRDVQDLIRKSEKQ